MARIVLVHGAFNELWGPHELKSRWLPALRDGLWHHGVEVGPIRTFVTMGSPLASPMIFDSLDPTPVDGKGQWPGPIERWVNVRAVGDKAGAVSLKAKFGDRIEECIIDNGHRPHDPGAVPQLERDGRRDSGRARR